MLFDYKKLFNSGLFGLSDPQRYSEPYQVHPLIKRVWGSVDVLREALGYTANFAEIPSTTEDETLVNERIVESFTFAAPLTTYINGTGYTTPVFNPSVLSYGAYEEATVTVTFSPPYWNSLNLSPLTENLLLEEGYGTSYEGDPYFGKYYYNPSQIIPVPSGPITLPPETAGLMPSDNRMAGAQYPVAPLMRRGQLPIDNSGQAYKILDHRYRLLGYPVDNVDIVPTYNFYLDSDPDYEGAIGVIPEGRLPNYYVFELAVDARRTGVVTPLLGVNSKMIGDALGLDFADTEAIINGSIEGSTPQTDQLVSQGYFHTYASTAPNVSDAASNTYLDEYQDIAILSRALDDDLLETYNLIARDDRGTEFDTSDDLLAIDNDPFYNKITIPYFQQYNQPIITDALAQALTPDLAATLMTIVELYTIYTLRNPGGEAGLPTLSFNFYEGNENILTDQNVSIPIVGYLEYLLRAIYNPTASMQTMTINSIMNHLVTQYEEGMYANVPGFLDGVQYLRTIAALEADQTSLPPDSLSNQYSSLQNVSEERSLGAISDVARAFEDLFLAGIHAPGQTLMYVVEKRVVPATQTSIDITDPSAPAPVQTFYFGRDNKERDILYYDTQIKYGVRYQYDLKRVEMVVGNEYEYVSANTVMAPEDIAGEGRALGNALGFYDDPAIWTTPSENEARDWIETQPEEAPIGVTAPSGLPFDYYSPSAPNPNAEPLYKRTEQVGYYIYGLSSARASGPFAGQSLGQIYPNMPAIYQRSWDVKADIVRIEIQTGLGENGNTEGGMTPYLAAPVTSILVPSSPPTGPTPPPLPPPPGPAQQKAAQELMSRLDNLSEQQAVEFANEVAREYGSGGSALLTDITRIEGTQAGQGVGPFAGQQPGIEDLTDLLDDFISIPLQDLNRG
jgi:hypothetical protein